MWPKAITKRKNMEGRLRHGEESKKAQYVQNLTKAPKRGERIEWRQFSDN